MTAFDVTESETSIGVSTSSGGGTGMSAIGCTTSVSGSTKSSSVGAGGSGTASVFPSLVSGVVVAVSLGEISGELDAGVGDVACAPAVCNKSFN